MTLPFPRPIARWGSSPLLPAAVAAGAPPSETPGVSVAATPHMGKQGRRIVKQDGVEVWAKPLEDHAFAVILFNRSARPRNLAVRFSDSDKD